jgi:hypothetical protein
MGTNMRTILSLSILLLTTASVFAGTTTLGKGVWRNVKVYTLSVVNGVFNLDNEQIKNQDGEAVTYE